MSKPTLSREDLLAAVKQSGVSRERGNSRADFQSQALWHLLGMVIYALYTGFMYRSGWRAQAQMIAFAIFILLSWGTTYLIREGAWLKNLAIGYIGGETFLNLFLSAVSRR